MPFNSLTSFIKEPKTIGLDIDSPETTIQRAEIIKNKYFLNRLYQEWYDSINKEIPSGMAGKIVELGSGAGFLRTVIPDLITSDIFYLPEMDIVLDGHRLPFKQNSLKAIVMIDVLHHLNQVDAFISEAARCIKTGGRIIMIEPWNTCWSKIIYTYLHHEPFKPGAEKWTFHGGGALSQANSALPWIIFKRDLDKFKSIFPEWQVKDIVLHTPFRYLISGGVSFRCLMPDGLFPFWTRLEKSATPWMNILAMFARIVLIKRD